MRLLALFVLVAGATTARAGEIEVAEAAVRELRYPQARAILTQLLQEGHRSRTELVQIYALAAEVATVLDGPEAGERAYRRLLVIDSSLEKPRRDTPVFAGPFERAHRWVETDGILDLQHTPPAQVLAAAPIELRVRVASNPLAMVWAVRALVHRSDGTWERQGSDKGTRVMLPPRAAGERVDYYLEIVDERQNVLRELGSPAEPFQLAVTAPVVAARHRRALLWPALGVGLTAVAALAAGVGLDVSASAEFGRLNDSCAPACTSDQLSAFRYERGFAIAGYTLGGAAAITALILVTIDRLHARR